MTLNKHGLSREIPSAIKKNIRAACGYGCVLCGNGIYQYEHIDPPYSDAKEHVSEKIALLCGACHDNVTRKIWSKDKIIEARNKPYCISTGTSSLALDIKNGDGFIIKIGNTEFVNLQSIIQIDGVEILKISPPESVNSPPIISAQFFDRKNRLIAKITENECSADAFDIETKGSTITVRSGDRKLDLILTMHPPSMLHIDQLHMNYNDKTITGNSRRGFVVSTEKAKVNIPSDPIKIQKAPFWLSVSNKSICLGTDTVIDFVGADGHKQKLSGNYEIKNAELTLLDPEENGVDPPPGWKTGEKIMKITSMGEGSGVGMKFNLPKSDHRHRPQAQASMQPFKRAYPKVGRNQLCPCGSGQKYKKCHGK